MSDPSTHGLTGLSPRHRDQIAALPCRSLARGTVLFHQGDTPKGFVLVISGRIEVYLTGPGGREVLLYAVEPGQSCVQTTLGLLGEVDYSGEAITATTSEVVLIPRGLFLTLMEDDAAFRGYVFSAFATRMQSMMHLLEMLAFRRIESRLAGALLDRMMMSGQVNIQATHQELATQIGSVREVVSRRLEAFSRAGMVSTDRGIVTLLDTNALRRLAENTDAA